MNATLAVVLALVVLAVVVLLVLVLVRRRGGDDTAGLRERFGPEYDRAVQERGEEDAHRWMRDLLARRDRLEVHSLAPESADRHAEAWEAVQARFVESPDEALGEADALLMTVMAERGYPVTDTREDTPRSDWVAVDHPSAAPALRDAERARGGGAQDASTEQFREALLHYRAVVEALLERPVAGHDTAHTPAATPTHAEGAAGDGR